MSREDFIEAAKNGGYGEYEIRNGMVVIVDRKQDEPLLPYVGVDREFSEREVSDALCDLLIRPSVEWDGANEIWQVHCEGVID